MYARNKKKKGKIKKFKVWLHSRLKNNPPKKRKCEVKIKKCTKNCIDCRMEKWENEKYVIDVK